MHRYDGHGFPIGMVMKESPLAKASPNGDAQMKINA
jgi:hypothetical protein